MRPGSFLPGADSTPDDFRFAWKASRFISHFRRLLVNENSMTLLESRLQQLGYKPAEVQRLLKGIDAAGLTTEEIIMRALQAAAAK